MIYLTFKSLIYYHKISKLLKCLLIYRYFIDVSTRRFEFLLHSAQEEYDVSQDRRLHMLQEKTQLDIVLDIVDLLDSVDV